MRMPYRSACDRLCETPRVWAPAVRCGFYCIRDAHDALLICRPRQAWNGGGVAALKRDLSENRISVMRRHTVSVPAFAALALAAAALSACGHTTEQRAATGAIAGAVVAGPVGAAVGGAAGAARPD